jgi:hypothetical protein
VHGRAMELTRRAAKRSHRTGAESRAQASAKVRRWATSTSRPLREEVEHQEVVLNRVVASRMKVWIVELHHDEANTKRTRNGPPGMPIRAHGPDTSCLRLSCTSAPASVIMQETTFVPTHHPQELPPPNGDPHLFRDPFQKVHRKTPAVPHSHRGRKAVPSSSHASRHRAATAGGRASDGDVIRLCCTSSRCFYPIHSPQPTIPDRLASPLSRAEA